MTRGEAVEEVVRAARLVVDPPSWESQEWVLLGLRLALEDYDRAVRDEKEEE